MIFDVELPLVVDHTWDDAGTHHWSVILDGVPEIVGEGDTEDEACNELFGKLARMPIH